MLSCRFYSLAPPPPSPRVSRLSPLASRLPPPARSVQGSGKTFAFLLPVVASFFAPECLATAAELEVMGVVMDPDAPEGVRSPQVIGSEIDDQRGCMPRAIILAPTRELASQIAVEARKLIHNSDVKAVVVYGGADIRAQVIFTPPRLMPDV